MTDILLKDSTEILEELSKPYGCYGITTVDGLGIWIDQWLANDGEEGALSNIVMTIDTQTRHMTMWAKEVF